VYTYRAYCITPLVPSWLGNGTSLCSLPVMVFIEAGGGGLPLTRPGWRGSGMGFAFLELEEEIEATATATLKGWRAAVGLAV
jgi:hypothetical protein